MEQRAADTDGSDHVVANRRLWDGADTEGYRARAHGYWAAAEPFWGIWRIPQHRLPVIPDDVAGQDAVELGCGTGYVSAWLARRGARPVGVDNSTRQLTTAKQMQAVFDLRFPLIHADAERVPLRDGCADLVISEYGAAIWCDPYRWLPEAARLLRPGGRLAFMGNSTLLALCTPDDDGTPVTDRLVRDLFGLHRHAWPDGGVEFNLPHGERIRLLRECGLELLDLVEVRAPVGGHNVDIPGLGLEWARRWPSEEVWYARRT